MRYERTCNHFVRVMFGVERLRRVESRGRRTSRGRRRGEKSFLYIVPTIYPPFVSDKGEGNAKKKSRKNRNDESNPSLR